MHTCDDACVRLSSLSILYRLLHVSQILLFLFSSDTDKATITILEAIACFLDKKIYTVIKFVCTGWRKLKKKLTVVIHWGAVSIAQTAKIGTANINYFGLLQRTSYICSLCWKLADLSLSSLRNNVPNSTYKPRCHAAKKISDSTAQTTSEVSQMWNSTHFVGP